MTTQKTTTTKNALDKAIDKSRGIVEVPEEVTSLANIGGDVSGAVTEFTPELLAQLMASGDFESGERIVELTEGMMVRGQLIGHGPMANILDPNTRQPKQLGTWRMRLESGITVSFLTAAQLDRQLPQFIGRRGVTCIARGGKVMTKGQRQMSEYLVLGPKATAPVYKVELREGVHHEVG